MNILGISAYCHDSAACLVRDGEIIAAAQEERFSRKKHDPGFPRQAIAYCLEAGGVTARQLDIVAFYEKPFLKFERLLETYLATAPFGIRSFIKAMPVWIKEKLWIKDLVAKELGFTGRILFPEHHESHAASAFFPSPFPEAAVLTMDAAGEWATSSIAHGQDHHLKLLKELRFPHSLGMLYSAFTYYTGFRVNSGEYKVMGLAPYGEPRFKALILSELMNLKDDGSFTLNLRYFDYCAGLRMTNRKFDRLFGGPPRTPETKLRQKDMDLARSVQEVTEEVMVRMARHAQEITRSRNLCLAGGVALNCVGNGRILREKIFDHLWIQPAAGDAGGALGAALLAWHQYEGKERKVDGRRDAMKGAYLGPEFQEDVLDRFIQEQKIPAVKLSQEELPGRVADLIAQGKVIGWFQGRMEFGPRALGARSILGDPRSPTMQKIMNVKIKFREGFRPFAPSVLREEAGHYFDLAGESPYMLLVAPVRPELRKSETAEQERLWGIEKLNVIRSSIPAVTHVDYSARVQTVDRETNPLYYRMIEALGKKHGCPLVINTSFNVRGEPLVCRPEEAYRCFMRTDMDYLVLGPYVIEKSQQQPLQGDLDWRKQFTLD